ncbi:MAG: VWA domain-containing protein [Chitinophagales bacterium]
MTERIRVIIHFALKTFWNLLLFIPALAILYSSYFIVPASAQTTRILFVLDASGSMKGEWNGTSKFELAKNILNNTIDSVSRTNQKVEFALRVFGHQSPRASLNCKDTRLEAAFAKGNAAAIAQRLKAVHPQGQTPIEFTLLQSLDDFPEDSQSTNAIILITDGSETCGGNLCDLTRKFEEKKIALRPFIVGLGLSDSLKKKFECLGSFYDVQDEDALSTTMKIVISRVLNPTTCQFNLLDAYGNPNETNVEITLYDHVTKDIRYSFIHTLNAKGIPDTLTLDQRFVYDLEVHSIPEVVKEKIQLVPGIHNVIPAEVPMGSLEIRLEASTGNFTGISCIVRKATEKEILFVQDVNSSLRYITGAYDLEMLTLPRTIIKNVLIQEAKITSIKIPRAGTLLLTPSEAGIASIFLFREKVMEKVYELSSIKTQKSVSLQPGNYLVVFRGDRFRQAERTKQISVEILSGKTSSIRL